MMSLKMPAEPEDVQDPCATLSTAHALMTNPFITSDTAARHLATAAYETILLCSGGVHTSGKWADDDARRAEIVDRMRPRLGVSRKMHSWLIERLKAVPLPSEGSIATAEHRKQLITQPTGFTTPFPAEEESAFADRQHCLLQAMGPGAVGGASAPRNSFSARRSSDASASSPVASRDSVIIEGWLEKMPSSATPFSRRVTWHPRYVMLRASGQLTWSQDEQGTKLRAGALSAATVVSLPADGTLHIANGRPRTAVTATARRPPPPLVLRAPPDDPTGRELLRRWAAAIEAHKEVGNQTTTTRKSRILSVTNRGSVKASVRGSVKGGGGDGGGGSGGGSASDGAADGSVVRAQDDASLDGSGEGGAAPWPPHVAFALYRELVRAASFQPVLDLSGDSNASAEGTWQPEAQLECAEALALLRCTWPSLRVTAHTHAVALLQETSELYASAPPYGEAHDELLSALERDLKSALSAQAAYSAIHAQSSSRVDAVVEGAARLKRAGRLRQTQRETSSSVSGGGAAGGAAGSGSEGEGGGGGGNASVSGGSPHDPRQMTAAASVIQREVIGRILRLRAERSVAFDLFGGWATQRLSAVVSGALSRMPSLAIPPLHTSTPPALSPPYALPPSTLPPHLRLLLSARTILPLSLSLSLFLSLSLAFPSLLGITYQLGADLEDYRLLDPSEMATLARLWQTASLASVSLRHEPSVLGALLREGLGETRLDHLAHRLTPSSVSVLLRGEREVEDQASQLIASSVQGERPPSPHTQLGESLRAAAPLKPHADTCFSPLLTALAHTSELRPFLFCGFALQRMSRGYERVSHPAASRSKTISSVGRPPTLSRMLATVLVTGVSELAGAEKPVPRRTRPLECCSRGGSACSLTARRALRPMAAAVAAGARMGAAGHARLNSESIVSPLSTGSSRSPRVQCRRRSRRWQMAALHAGRGGTFECERAA